jgi:deoxyribose-phosphate aldolase
MSITVHDLAKMIDHSLLHPTMTDEILIKECKVALKYDVATVCIKPYAVPMATELLAGSDVKVCAVSGFPHGNSHTDTIIFEAMRACKEGATEIDIVSNTGKVLGGDWNYVEAELKAVNEAVVSEGAILKVIFENDFLEEAHILRLCEICSTLDIAFVKTSTGYGFVKQDNGFYTYKGATEPHLKIMRENSKASVEVKAAGGVRTLADLVRVRQMGVTRIGATATAVILDEASKRIEAGEDLALLGDKPLGGATY